MTTGTRSKIFTAEIVKNNNDDDLTMIKKMSNSINSLHSSHKSCSTSSSYAQKINILGVEIIKLPSILEKEIRIRNNDSMNKSKLNLKQQSLA